MLQRTGSRGFTLIELLIVVGIIGILAAIAIPGLTRARQSGNEASAIGSLRAISSGQVSYASSCGSGGYAQTLADLSKPAPAGGAFVGADLSTDPAVKSGYEVVLDAETSAVDVVPGASTCNAAANPSVSGYWAGGRPLQVGVSGQRSFATDARGAIFQQTNGATHIANPIPSGAAVFQ